jgi:hypothetical protein
LVIRGQALYNGCSSRLPPLDRSKDALMRWIAALGVCLWAAVSWTPAEAQLVATAAAPRSTEADQIRGWYRDYLGREVGPELSAWVKLLSGGMSAIDVQATILGSDEFYYQKGRDPQTFVRETLQSVNWAEPSPAELRRWTDRLNQLRGDRLTLAREIVLAAAQPQAPANQAGDVVARLPGAARLVVDTIDFEIGGTTQGQQANLRARSLLDACGHLQQVASSVSYRPDEALRALDNADRSYQALLQTLNDPPGTAPSAMAIVRRVGTLLGDARALVRPPVVGPTYPPSTPSGNYGYDARQVAAQAETVSRAAESLAQLLASQAYQNYSYSVALRDLDTFASRVEAFEQSLTRGTSRERLSWELESLREQAGRIRPQVLSGRPPYFARLYWQSVESGLDQLRDTLGPASGSSGGSSTVLRPAPMYENLVTLLDQATSQLDVFLTGTSPLVYGIPEVPRVQRDARALKSRILTLRQQAGAAEPAPVLKQSLQAMVGDYQAAFDRWNQVVAANRLINPARLSPVGETLNRVEQLINDALASGDLPAAGPTRVGQLLTALNSDVTIARRSLAAFAGYREQQSIDLYLTQLSDYVQSINESLARAGAVDSRRLAVAMQGVVGRMQADIDGLSQRVAAAGTREQRQQAASLDLLAGGIGKLVDDIEAALY